MSSPKSLVLLAFLMLAPSAACKGDGTKSATKENSEPGSTDSAGKDKAPLAKKKGRVKKDKGEASMKVGDFEWRADGAAARHTDKALSIHASRNDMSGDSVKRQELHLVIDNYAGPGDYTTSLSGSRFVGVGLDIAAGKAAKGDDAEAKTLAMESLAKAEHMMLSKATIKITASSDSEISGSFSWTPASGLDKPAIREGSFRAIVK